MEKSPTADKTLGGQDFSKLNISLFQQVRSNRRPIVSQFSVSFNHTVKEQHTVQLLIAMQMRNCKLVKCIHPNG